MGIEKLSTAARAAGFAMATSDELLTSSPPRRAVCEVNPWQSVDVRQTVVAVPARAPTIQSLKSTATDIRKNVTAFLGWGAPA